MARSAAQKAADKRYAAKVKCKYDRFVVHLLPDEYKHVCDVIASAGLGKTQFLRMAVAELEKKMKE